MARIERLPKSEQTSLPAMSCPSYDDKPWVAKKPLSSRRIAIVNTAGLMLRTGERPVAPRAPGYRVIANDLSNSEVMMSHVSVNFDRSGFYADHNVALPREHLAALAAEGVIGSVANEHYSFMGATEPDKMEPHARELAGNLIESGVDTILLIPV